VTAVVAVVEGAARDVTAPDGVTVVRAPGSGDDALVAEAGRLTAAGVDVLVSSFNPDALATVRETAPELPTALLFEFDPVEHLGRAVDLDCAAVHPHHEQCSEGLVRRAHAAGLSVHTWTVADAATAAALDEAGVDGVVADRPDVLSDAVGS
jgi:glycerophosphoryl diester phosphodiesterase